MPKNPLAKQLETDKEVASASEVHGFVAGWIAAGTAWASARSALQESLELSPSADLEQLLDKTSTEVAEGLSDVDFGFEILLPDDEAGLNKRRIALSEWCQGFLTGFGLTGRFQDSELSDEVRELLQDFAQISQVDDELPEDEENESDLTEITEYVRMGAIMVFTDCATKAVH